MVVSEIMDRLSPNMAPQITAATHSGREKPVDWLTPAAMGARAAMVPTEVPMDSEMKQAIRNMPHTASLAGMKDRNRYTVESAPPAALIVPEKMPASRKIRHIVMMLSSASPWAMT